MRKTISRGTTLEFVKSDLIIEQDMASFRIQRVVLEPLQIIELMKFLSGIADELKKAKNN